MRVLLGFPKAYSETMPTVLVSKMGHTPERRRTRYHKTETALISHVSLYGMVAYPPRKHWRRWSWSQTPIRQGGEMGIGSSGKIRILLILQAGLRTPPGYMSPAPYPRARGN